MLTTYRRVLSTPGALAFSLSGLVARLPIAMVSLGIVLLVSTRTGSYGLAGGVAAAYLVANAVSAIVQGRLIDRFGQGRVLPVTIGVFSTALSLMVWAVQTGQPTPLPHVLAALAGAALPQIGSCVRARWSALVPDKRALHTAFSFEAVVDETVFMLGPMLVTVLATMVHPVAGLATAVAAGLLGTLVLAAQRGTEPPSGRLHDHTGVRPPMGWHVLGPLVATAFTMGVLFGGAEVATVAFAEEQGAKAAAGPLLAAWALGSLLSGFLVGSVHWTVSTATRYRVGMLALGLSLVPMPFVGSLEVMGVLLFLAGFTISPPLIAGVAWVEETVPAARLTEGIAILSTGLYAGLAPGAALVGVVVDRYGASPAYWVAVVAVLAGAGVAFATALLPPRPPRVSRPSPSGSSA